MPSPRALALASLLLCAACDAAQLSPIDAGVGPERAEVPLPPPAELEGPSSEPQVFVLRDVVLRQGGGAWRALGYDLDGRCSYPPDALDGGAPDGGGPYPGWDIECAPVNSGDLPSGDGALCRDNNYGQFISLGFEPLGIDVQAEARELMEAGEYALMLRLSDWNGEEDDPRVTVEVVQTAFGQPAGGLRGDPLRWDGTDTFFPSEAAFDDFGEPVLLDRTGYVVGGVVVMRIPPRSDFDFAGGARSLSVRITDATLTGRLAGDRLEDVALSGRWPVSDFLNELDDLGVCEGETLRGIVETAIRGSADVLANPEATPGTLVPCDAVSVAIGFTGYPGRWGADPQPPPALPAPCPP